MNFKKTTLIIPAAGHGIRFVAAGYTQPKPLIPVAGKPMLDWVLRGIQAHRFSNVLVLAQEGFHHKAIQHELRHRGNVDVVPVGPAQYGPGAAATLLAAANVVNPTERVLVLNCDAVIAPHDWSFFESLPYRDIDGCVVTFEPPHTKARRGPFSYVDVDKNLTWLNGQPLVKSIYEKTPVRRLACAGGFYFSSYALLYYAITQQMKQDSMVGGEYYLAPCYNVLIADGVRVTHYPLGKKDVFIRMGVPSDLPVANRILRRAK